MPTSIGSQKKAEEPEIKIANIHWITEKARAREFQKKTSASLIMLKPLTVWITTNLKILNENTSIRILPLEKSVCRSRSNC